LDFGEGVIYLADLVPDLLVHHRIGIGLKLADQFSPLGGQPANDRIGRTLLGHVARRQPFLHLLGLVLRVLVRR
jgi:hypothetical protein